MKNQLVELLPFDGYLSTSLFSNLTIFLDIYIICGCCKVVSIDEFRLSSVLLDPVYSPLFDFYEEGLLLLCLACLRILSIYITKSIALLPSYELQLIPGPSGASWPPVFGGQRVPPHVPFSYP